MAWGTDAPDAFPAPQPVTGLGPARDGVVIVGAVGGLLRLDPASGVFDRVWRLSGDRHGNRGNDMGVDHAGNLWVGTMTCVLRGVGIPVTMVWDTEGRLVTADSMTGVVRRITVTPGGVAERIEEVTSQAAIGVPDRLALAADGILWNT